MSRLEQRLDALEHALGGRNPVAGGGHERPDGPEQPLEVGRELGEVLECRPEVVGRPAQIADERVRVAREPLEPPDRGARLAQEGRQHLERVGQRVVP